MKTTSGAGKRLMTATPALILDLDALESNIELMAAKARKWGVALRPHAKTHKCSEIARRQIMAGAVGVTCATLGEAELMVRAGIPSVLVSSPVVSEAQIRRLVDLLSSDTDICVAVDDLGNIVALSSAVAERSKSLSVVVDFDVGHQRTGCISIDEACRVASLADSAPELSFRGLQAYAGHIQHIDDVVDREAEAGKVRARVEALASALDAIGLHPVIRTGGGSGTADFDGPHQVFTELQVGSYIFMDVEYLSIGWPNGPSSGYRTALFVDTTVVSAGWVTHVTTDAGLKAFAQGGPTPSLINVDPHWKYSTDSDEHGRVDRHGGAPLPGVGTRLTCVVPHCDPTVSQYREYVCVRSGDIAEIWPIEPRR